MPRVPYLPADVEEPRDLVADIRARRGGALLHLDRMLLHSPPLARGWNGFLRAVRTELGVAPKLRELAICAVAALNGADYELHHHRPELLRAGATEEQAGALRDPAAAAASADRFDATERAVLQLAVEMTRDVAVRDATFDAVLRLLGPRGAVELVAVVATYAMVSRFLVALEIQPET
jgi:AhpD family alkylhydroperoxidase